PDEELTRLHDQAKRLGDAGLVRAMEVLGEALIDMREAPDARVLLEVALVRLCKPSADTSPAALLDRIERLERGATSTSTTAEPTTARAAPAAPPSAAARAALGNARSER